MAFLVVNLTQNLLSVVSYGRFTQSLILISRAAVIPLITPILVMNFMLISTYDASMIKWASITVILS